MTSARPPGQPGARTVHYAEDHCALRWPLLAAGLYAPLLALALAVLAVIFHGARIIPWVCLAGFGLSVVAWAAFGQMLPHVWPVGIRLDSEGVHIGGVRWSERHPGRARDRKATVPNQYSQVFSCSWEGVSRMWVETDRKRLKDAIRHAPHGQKATPLGNLSAPFMRAALIVVVKDREHARLPEIRPARGLLYANWSSPGYYQPMWAVPTRRPGQLGAAIEALPLPEGTFGGRMPDAAGMTVPEDFME